MLKKLPFPIKMSATHIGGTCFKEIIVGKQKKYAQFIWMCIKLMEAANEVAAYISELDL